MCACVYVCAHVFNLNLYDMKMSFILSHDVETGILLYSLDTGYKMDFILIMVWEEVCVCVCVFFCVGVCFFFLGGGGGMH